MITIKEAEEILKHEYHIDNYLFMVKELILPDYVSDTHEVVFNNNIFESVTQLGYSSKCEVSVFEVLLKEGAQNRRVTITQEMFRILRGQGVSNAIVAFSNADKRNYRLSLLTSKYEFDGNKIVKVLSNPRRYSYSLGYGTKTKTAYDFLISKGKVHSLDELIGRFSLEIVNKHFYNEIAASFTKLIGGKRDGKTFEKELNIYSVTNQNKYAEFAVRLIGRIVFCWFLKEKKSENGIPLIPEKMLSAAAIAESSNYYHDVLEPLFFELLNTNQNRRKGKFAHEEIYKQIPYLNGGLFAPHLDDKYKYSPATQTGQYGIVTIPNEWFAHFFSVLSQYNFTVDENTSYDIELSIDPEMLGRIFENLLAEINPETGENAKKSTGSFYTPRDIVDYMVDNSIFEYLKSKTGIDNARLKALLSYSKDDDDIAVFTKEEKKAIINALYTVTVLDPACGSGAFPIGMLQKIVYMLQEIDPEANLWFDEIIKGTPIYVRKAFEEKFSNGELNYIRKLTVIEKSIFGVDIQPIAVEIARLRCFLSLVIEEKVMDTEPNRGIKPLPSLDFKFIIANSLIPLEENKQISLFENQDHIEELKTVREEYFNADNERKSELREEFSDIQKRMLQTTIDQYTKLPSKRYELLYRWSPFKNEATDWFDPEWMFGVKDGFDIVIANPPYIDSETMLNSGLEDVRDYISKRYSFTKGNWDIYIAFFELAYKLTKGCLIYITPDKWISKPFGDALRIGIIDNIISILNAGRDVFETARVDSIITLVDKRKHENIIVERFNQDKKVYRDAFVNKKLLTSPFALDIIFSKYLSIFEKISEKKDKKLDDIAVCKNACATSDCYLLKELLYSLEDNFKYDSSKMLKVINTGTIGRFASRWGIQEMRYLKDKYLYPVVDSDKFFSKFLNSYAEKSVKKKIIIKGLTLLDCCIDLEGEVIPGKSTMMIASDNAEELFFIMAYLNSKLPIFYIKQKYSSASYNGGINFSKEMINSLPIANKLLDNKSEIIELSKKIYSKKSMNYSEERDELEGLIDKIVYDSFDLTKEEITLIEESLR